MPTKPPKACAKFGCNLLTTQRFCVAHAREEQQRRAKHSNWSHTSRQSRGYGTAWDALRRHVLERDRHSCVRCATVGVRRRATDVDHIRPKSEGGSDHPANLQSLCAECHKMKTQADNARQRQRRKR